MKWLEWDGRKTLTLVMLIGGASEEDVLFFGLAFFLGRVDGLYLTGLVIGVSSLGVEMPVCGRVLVA